MHRAGLADLDWPSYTPLALYNEDPAGVGLRADAPRNNAQELLDASRDTPPGTFEASGTGQGGLWHLALAGMPDAAGLEPNRVSWAPSQDAAPGLQELVAGGVDIVTCWVPEAEARIGAGKVKRLAAVAEQRNPAFPAVPTLAEATGLDWTLGAWCGIAVPKGLPQEVVDRLGPVPKKIHESREFRDFLAQRGFGVIRKGPEAFAAFMVQRDAALGAVMKTLRLARG